MSALAETPGTARPVLGGERVAVIRAIHDGPVQDLFGTALMLDHPRRGAWRRRTELRRDCSQRPDEAAGDP